MTANKDLQRLVRERQAKTGERYTAALVQLRAKAKPIDMEVAEIHDVSLWAKQEDFHCRAVVSEGVWRTLGLSAKAGQRFRELFARLRALLAALGNRRDESPPYLAVLAGKRCRGEMPSPVEELAEARRFFLTAQAALAGIGCPTVRL